MPSQPIGRGGRVVIQGIDVGAADARPVPTKSVRGPLELKLSFRPNWVGIWKLQAALADRPPD